MDDYMFLGLGYSYDDVVDDDIIIRLARCAL